MCQKHRKRTEASGSQGGHLIFQEIKCLSKVWSFVVVRFEAIPPNPETNVLDQSRGFPPILRPRSPLALRRPKNLPRLFLARLLAIGTKDLPAPRATLTENGAPAGPILRQPSERDVLVRCAKVLDRANRVVPAQVQRRMAGTLTPTLPACSTEKDWT
jgi:hypothetical protein